MSQFFALGGQSIGVSASVSVLPMNIQGWFPLGLTGLISLLSKGFSRVFSSTTVWKHQFFCAQPFLWSSSHISTWQQRQGVCNYSILWVRNLRHRELTNPTHSSVQFSSVAQLCPTLCDPMNHSTPGLPVHHQLLEFTQTHIHWVGDAIQPSHPLPSPSPPALILSQHQGLFQWVSSSYQVAKVLEFQLQHQSFQWTPRTDLL